MLHINLVRHVDTHLCGEREKKKTAKILKFNVEV